MNQLEIHKKISELLKKNPDEIKPEEVNALLFQIRDEKAINDAREYFFFKADERWFDWLWENGFLEAIKKKAEDLTRYSYRIPELNYLAMVAEKLPSKVVNIILEVPLSSKTFNHEVIDRFVYICTKLPAEELSRVVTKIRDEKWIPLMGIFNQWGFEYEEMFKTLANAGKYEELLILAEAVLSIRSKKEIEKKEDYFEKDNPFYFNDLSYTKVFEYLTNVSDEYIESALALLSKTLKKIILAYNKNEKDKKDSIFENKDRFHLFGVNFFALRLNKREHVSGEDNVINIYAAIKVLLERIIKIIKEKDENIDKIKSIYQKYIKSLPDTQTTWRFKLFVLSLWPEIFKNEIKKALFKLFEADENYYEIISGPEYEKTLQKTFYILEEFKKRDYVNKVIKFFSMREEDLEWQDWHKNNGSRILSVIVKYLTESEKKQAMKKGFRIDFNHEPKSDIVMKARSGYVKSRPPITEEEFNKLSVGEIVELLTNEWSPENLRKKYENDDIFSPRNAEGAKELLKSNIPKRLQEYVSSATLFFERDVLDEHYTHSFLQGIQETIKNQRSEASKIDWQGLFNLFLAIKDSGTKEPFKRDRKSDSFNGWLANWDSVHFAMADILQELISERDGFVVIDFDKYRSQIFEVLSYLLKYPDPVPEDERVENAKISETTDSGEDLPSDPFTIAINSVRGRAFQTFIWFVYLDGKRFSKDADVKIADDVKNLYEEILDKENTRSIMFVFGHYLPNFYFRDKKWILNLLSKIFPEELEKKYLYTASWEGYLANNLFEDIFFNEKIQKLYQKGLSLTKDDFPKQKHFINPNEGLAIHLALAFIYYKGFDFDHPLFKAFWEKGNIEHHSTFISFIGKRFISGDDREISELIKKEKMIKDRIKKLWDWVLENYKNSELFVEFGFWINLEKEIFEPSWLAERLRKTLEKTNGKLDWDYGLSKSINKLASSAPEDALEISRLYLLENLVRNGDEKTLYWDDEWYEALKILYQNKKVKDKVYNLINDLISEGGRIFWRFEEIIDDK